MAPEAIELKRKEPYRHVHATHIATVQTLGWSAVIVGVLVILTLVLEWNPVLQYIWGALAIILGLWTLTTR